MCFWCLLSFYSDASVPEVHMCQCPDSPRVFMAFIHQNLQLEGLQVLENTFCQPNVHLSRVVLGHTRAASTDASSQLQVT